MISKNVIRNSKFDIELSTLTNDTHTHNKAAKTKDTIKKDE